MSDDPVQVGATKWSNHATDAVLIWALVHYVGPWKSLVLTFAAIAAGFLVGAVYIGIKEGRPQP